jgi:hypothetical protein
MSKTIQTPAAARFESPLHLWIEIWQRQLAYQRESTLHHGAPPSTNSFSLPSDSSH